MRISAAAEQRIDVAKAAVAKPRKACGLHKNRYEAGLANVTDLLRDRDMRCSKPQIRYLAAIQDQRIGSGACSNWPQVRSRRLGRLLN